MQSCAIGTSCRLPCRGNNYFTLKVGFGLVHHVRPSRASIASSRKFIGAAKDLVYPTIPTHGSRWSASSQRRVEWHTTHSP